MPGKKSKKLVKHKDGTQTLETVWEREPWGFMYHWQICLGGLCCFGRRWEEFFYLLDEIVDAWRLKELKRLVIYVHNLGFELQFLYAFLYERQCWSTLSLSFEGCKYIAETKHYMNGLAECLLSYSANMDDKTQAYCVAVLRNVHLDDHYGPRFEAWKKKHLSKE
jgi:hypothetical protein